MLASVSPAGSGPAPVLVTGCSSGFGRELVSVLLGRGFHVLATLRGAQARQELFAAEAAAFPGRLELLELDVTRAADRDAVVEHVRTRHGGRLGCLINNAGVGYFGALEDASEDELRRQLEVNFFGLALLTRELLPALRSAQGRLIAISSVLGYTGLPLSALYCSSKYAVEGLMEAMSYELEAQGVQVCLVEPGSFRTRFSQNVSWVSGASRPESPYSGMTHAYRSLRERLGARLGGDPSPAVLEIARLLSRRRMPLRLKLGRDARAAAWLKRMLPDSGYRWLVARVYRRALRVEG
jgi:NAD(P)-dependent dehydrogenase (short-subunit alcohol dehydrogenase family)